MWHKTVLLVYHKKETNFINLSLLKTVLINQRTNFLNCCYNVKKMKLSGLKMLTQKFCYQANFSTRRY
jgi:hypothetical protein